MHFSNRGSTPNSSTLNIADVCVGFHPKKPSQLFSLCLALCRAMKSMAPCGPSHTCSVLQFGWSCSRCYFIWTYPVRWTGQVDCIPILRMENLSLGDLCEEMETRELEAVFQGHTASKWPSLSGGVPHPTQLPLSRTLRQILLHPTLRVVFLSVRALCFYKT